VGISTIKHAHRISAKKSETWIPFEGDSFARVFEFFAIFQPGATGLRNVHSDHSLADKPRTLIQRAKKKPSAAGRRELLPTYFNGIIDLLSNNSNVTSTPDGLRKLAIPQGSREAPSEPSEFPVHHLSARLSAKQIGDVLRRYETGESASTLATEFGIASSALLRLLRERNVVVRQQVVTPDQEQVMAQEYEGGMTIAERETKHGLSHGAVLRALHRSGVEMPAKAPRQKAK
jgi:hypothetical protein